LAGNSDDEVTLVRSVQGLVMTEKPSFNKPVLTSENEPKPDIEAKLQAICERRWRQKAAPSARLKAAKEGVGAVEGAAAAKGAAAATSTSTRGNEGRPAAASEAKSSTTSNKRTKEHQETPLSGSRPNKVKRTTIGLALLLRLCRSPLWPC
jgi:hypothetical protein